MCEDCRNYEPTCKCVDGTRDRLLLVLNRLNSVYYALKQCWATEDVGEARDDVYLAKSLLCLICDVENSDDSIGVDDAIVNETYMCVARHSNFDSLILSLRHIVEDDLR